MPPKTPTDTLLDKARRAAKSLARSDAMTHSEALEREAIGAGYRSWRDLVAANALWKGRDGKPAANESLPLDPALPDGFYDTANEERSAQEISTWWDRPYVVTRPDGSLDVRCLDGGAWDRPTFYGTAPDMVAAVELAARKLAAWRSFRDGPVAMMLEDGQMQAVRMPSRPGEDVEVLSEPMESEKLAVWMEAWRAKR